MNVLVIEDEEICAAFVENALKSIGCNVYIATNCADAWQLLHQSQQFQAILLDRKLPDEDGLSFLRKIKTMPDLCEIPVIMETALGDNCSIHEGMEAGAYYYLIKPLQRDLLNAIVTAAASQYLDDLALKKATQEKGYSLVQFMEKAVFKYGTLEEAKCLTQALAITCPDPGKVIVGLQELLINALEHGNLGIRYEEKTQLVLEGRWVEEVKRRQDLPENKNLLVKVDFERSPEFIKFTIQDQGNGFDWRKYMDFDPARAFDPHGRGIAMARMMSFDTLDYQGNGNTVEVKVLRTKN